MEVVKKNQYMYTVHGNLVKWTKMTRKNIEIEFIHSEHILLSNFIVFLWHIFQNIFIKYIVLGQLSQSTNI